MKGQSWRDVERIAPEFRPPVALRDRMLPVRVSSVNGTAPMVFVQFLASDEFAAIFDQVRNLMSGSGPMSYGDITLAVFRDYHDRHSPVARQARRFARSGSASLDSHRWEYSAVVATRHIPDEVRDAVWLRDGGQCTFVAADGTRCQSRRGLQVDHINPFANKGTRDLSNLRLLCGGHNRLAAERAMGRHVMRPYWRQQ
jgi:hypothetical protein